MLSDIQRGSTTEIDELNGAIIELGGQFKVYITRRKRNINTISQYLGGHPKKCRNGGPY